MQCLLTTDTRIANSYIICMCLYSVKIESHSIKSKTSIHTSTWPFYGEFGSEPEPIAAASVSLKSYKCIHGATLSNWSFSKLSRRRLHCVCISGGRSAVGGSDDVVKDCDRVVLAIGGTSFLVPYEPTEAFRLLHWILQFPPCFQLFPLEHFWIFFTFKFEEVSEYSREKSISGTIVLSCLLRLFSTDCYALCSCH